jgi:hypothetical protein
VTTGTYGLHQATDIRIAVGRVRQKVKGGAIVPKVIGSRRLPTGDVGFDPVDRFSGPAEPLFRRFESLWGKVEHRQPAETFLDQAID